MDRLSIPRLLHLPKKPNPHILGRALDNLKKAHQYYPEKITDDPIYYLSPNTFLDIPTKKYRPLIQLLANYLNCHHTYGIRLKGDAEPQRVYVIIGNELNLRLYRTYLKYLIGVYKLSYAYYVEKNKDWGISSSIANKGIMEFLIHSLYTLLEAKDKSPRKIEYILFVHRLKRLSPRLIKPLSK